SQNLPLSDEPWNDEAAGQDAESKRRRPACNHQNLLRVHIGLNSNAETQTEPNAGILGLALASDEMRPATGPRSTWQALLFRGIRSRLSGTTSPGTPSSWS